MPGTAASPSAATQRWPSLGRGPRRGEALDAYGVPIGAGVAYNASYAPGAGGNLSYQGGYVGHYPNLAIIDWGFAPANPATDPYDEVFTLVNLLQALESPQSGTWNNTVIQYTGLSGNPPYYANAFFPVNIGEFADTGSYPQNGYTDADVQAEVIRMAAKVAPGTNPYGNGWAYLVLTPTGVYPGWFPKPYCAYHYNIQYTAYAIMPYVADANKVNRLYSCGANWVNQGASGMLDAATIMGGHELAELLTNLVPSIATGWRDSNGQEIADKCAWENIQNVTFPDGQTFAMQPLWSNASSSCVLSYGPTPPASPTPGPSASPGPSPTPKPVQSPSGGCGGKVCYAKP